MGRGSRSRLLREQSLASAHARAAERSEGVVPKTKYIRQHGNGALADLRRRLIAADKTEKLLLKKANKLHADSSGLPEEEREVRIAEGMAKLETQLAFVNINLIKYAKDRGFTQGQIELARAELFGVES